MRELRDAHLEALDLRADEAKIEARVVRHQHPIAKHRCDVPGHVLECWSVAGLHHAESVDRLALPEVRMWVEMIAVRPSGRGEY